MDKFEVLKTTYLEKSFIDNIQDIRLIIEKDLIEFIKDVKQEKIKIFENLESRVKSVESFCEKIKRKNYINTWEVPEDKNLIGEFIAKNLPDLIGFRINCFFYDDEELIYKKLKNYYVDGKFGKEYYLNFGENTQQSNGHTIYKVSGNYNEINFEIQIKCSVHNIWGEVEHSRIYKSEHYDPKINSKKSITEEVFKILKSSDQQLKTIFEEDYSSEELIKSLFYKFTQEDVVNSENIKILSNHYQYFFNVFNSESHLENIKTFVSDKLVNKRYSPVKLEIGKSEIMTSTEFLNRYIPFEIEIMHKIVCIIYEEMNMDDFIEYLIKIIEEQATSQDEFDLEEDFFDSESEKEDLKNSIFAVYDNYFKKSEEK